MKRHIYVGDTDPAIDAIPGDLWIDTTGGYPYQHKERDAANDGWVFASLVARNPAGDVVALISVGDGGQASIVLYDPSDPQTPIAQVQVDSGGNINISGAGASLSIGGGAVTTTGNFIPILPTSDPVVAGQLWSDTGTVKGLGRLTMTPLIDATGAGH